MKHAITTIPSLPTYHQVILKHQANTPWHLPQRRPLRHLLNGDTLVVLESRQSIFRLEGVPILILAGVSTVRREHRPPSCLKPNGDTGRIAVVPYDVFLLRGAVVHGTHDLGADEGALGDDPFHADELGQTLREGGREGGREGRDGSMHSTKGRQPDTEKT
jgi:hypothetical protein